MDPDKWDYAYVFWYWHLSCILERENEKMSEQKQHPDAPQVAVTRELDKLTISAEMKVQARQYESVGAFRSYTFNIPAETGIVETERRLIEQAVAVAALTTDIQLAVGFEQAPRFRKLWEDWAHLCPVKWRGYLGLAEEE
jgi:hypothetical protein